MIKIKAKKGQLLLYGLIAGLIAAIVLSFINNVVDKKEFPVIGDSSLSLMDSSIEAEKALFYIDQSTKYSSHQGIYDLAKSGGCSSGNIYGTYRLWAVDSPKPGICFPSAEDSKNGFFDFLSNVFNNYLSSYKALNLPLNNYELSFRDTTLVGIAKEPLKLPLIEDISNKNLGAYSIKAPFKVNIENYDFSDYDALKLKSQDYIDACNDRAPIKCVIEKKSEFFDDGKFRLECPGNMPENTFLDYIWDSDVRYSIYGLCVNKTNDPLVYAYDSEEDATGYKNIAYKFALPFRDLKCTLENHPDLVNTKCMESSCGIYASCQDAAPLCYCTEGKNSCQGACLQFCSAYTGLGVPLQLGQPDANGIYKYMASGATPLWYRHIGNGNWQWTPYDPYSSLKCWMPVTTATVSTSCGGQWDGKKPVQANIDIITYLNENKPIPITSNLIIDSDASTTCTDYQCNNYLSCGSASSCGCSAAANACKGSDCQTLHCSRDTGFESKTGINTECKDQCSKYRDCASTNLCACDSGLGACQGSCYCNPKEWKNTGGCGAQREDNVQCEWNEIPQKREYNPSTCSSPDYRCELQPVEVCQLPCTPYECAGTCEAYDENCDIIPADDCC